MSAKRTQNARPFRAIESCGIIGNLQSVALVSTAGTIDWCCLPRFDSPSIFAALLDRGKGGNFGITPYSDGVNRQMYLPETNVLMTRFLRPDGVCEVLDFMPVCETAGPGEEGPSEIIRIVRGVRGTLRMKAECSPAFGYALEPHTAELHAGGAVFRSANASITLSSPVPITVEGSSAIAEFTIHPKQSLTFCLRFYEGAPPEEDAGALVDGEALLDQAVRFWRGWINRCTYTGRWRERIIRSALTLKLLTYRPSGAIVAAATCSLPEEIGGERNWDYRYTWIRDAAFTVYAFLRLGFTEEASAFMGWLEKRAHEQERVNGPLNVMYAIDGRHDLTESVLSHFEGYRGSAPVRVGNAAYSQLQLDIYGELIDSIYLYDKHASPVSYSFWQQVRGMLNWVARNWEQPDEGMWEVRTERRQFVYSKLQCWVALDRGLRLANRRSLPLDRQHLERERDRIFEWIMTNGWDNEQQCFVQAAGAQTLDAANLLMPIVHFIAPTDPRMLSTLDRTIDTLVSDSLVYRYQLRGERAAEVFTDDGLSGAEGTFSMCTFWLVEALARAGRLDEARFIFEKMLTYCNHLGLYSEEIGPTGEALGNFPQAFTHLGLVSAALNLNARLDGKEYAS